MSGWRTTIRAARRGEARRLGELAVRSKGHWGYSPAFLERSRDELAVDPGEIEAGRVYVLEDSGRVVGFYSLEPISRDTMELCHLFVEPDSIGSGHGRALMDHARAVAREQGYLTLLIQGDPNATRFYEAAGAVRVGSRESASIPGRQLPLLELALEHDDPG